MSSTLGRLRNLLIRWRSGLPSPGKAVSPLIDNDLFQAHLSLYLFAAGFAAGRRCLDLGCGTGYGTAHLVAAGAREAVGVDVDPKCIAFARRRFGSDRVRFVVEDAATVGAQGDGVGGSFGLAVAANLLVHVPEPGAVVRRAARLLEPEGTFLAAVPPILDGQTMDLHRTLPSHRSNLYLWDWEDLFRASFGKLRLFRQVPPADRHPDLASAGPPRVRAEELRFEEIALADLYDAGTLAAVFACSEPRQ